ncbi:MAG TPA: FKBP-type peptidyl-prolyl cis-trans isomerase [Dehalococcoidia bacterium]|nr:FKBP-type peptidyl-prolyl cis-trans isomerase [Dehalococcoidia bacterium]
MLADGTVVKVHYRGTLDDGSVFDSSEGKRPRTFVLGRGQLIPDFENTLREMAPGDVLDFHVELEGAYGPHRADRTYRVAVGDAPEGLAVGQEVQLAGGAPGRVTEITADMVTLDANHPLAGQPLNFHLELIEAVPPGEW